MKKNRNENRPGFKKTKVGWIPVEWDFAQLKDGITLISGQHVDAEACSDIPKGTPYITGPICFNNGKVTSHRFTKEPLKMCETCDILITVKGSGTGTVACADRAFCISRQIMAVRAKTWDQQFLRNRFEMDAVMYNHLSNGLIPGISREDILLHKIPLPPLPEQKAITFVLECWDRAIQKYEEKIEKKKNIKKGLMQRFLSGEQRLPGFNMAWKIVTLCKIGEFSKGKGIAKKDLSASGLQCIRYGEIYTTDDFIKACFRSRISSERAAGSTLIQNNDLLFAGSGETLEDIGKSIAYIGSEEAYAGGDIVILSCFKDDIQADFLSYYLNTQGRPSLRRLGQGQSVVHIYAKHLATISIPLPPLPEQRAITSVLSSADSEIKALEKKLTVVKDQKKYLLNNLVTGTIRLPEFRADGGN